MRTNTGGSRRRKLLNLYRVFTILALAVLMVTGAVALNKLSDMSDRSFAPTAAEVAQAVNGPAKFQRPGSMEYVAKTNSCVVGGTVTSTDWHVGNKTVGVGDVDGSTVDYTALGFKSDDGRVFTVSRNGVLYTEPGENLGLELYCDAATMNTAPSFGIIAIIYGGA